MGDDKDTAPRSKRGKNWTEADSLKLVDVYQQIQFEKHGTPPPPLPSFLMPLDSDPAGVIDDKIAAKFNESSPETEGRSTAAIKERWKKMVESYRFPFQNLY
jgi:hypothetical protein